MFIINKIRASGGHIQLTRGKKDIMYIFFNVGLKSTLELMLLLYSFRPFEVIC
jgi:hypothetical protein